LRLYLREHQDLFHRTLTAKLLAYALGRGELASDRQLVHNMLADVRSGDGSIANLVVDIVQSRQFRHRRASPAANAAVAVPGDTTHADR